MAFRWKDFPEEDEELINQANKPFASYRAAYGMDGYVPNIAGYATARNVDPGLMASQNMQGYNPNNVYLGRTPVVGGGDGAGYQFDSREIDSYLAGQQNRQQLLSRLSELQSQLASIDSQIAQIDRDYPGMKNGQAWEIAAKRAEIGDMAGYDNMLSREAQAASSSGIAGDLKSVEGKLSLIKSDNTEQSDYIKQQARVALNDAREWADRTGGQLPSSYYRVKEALDNAENVGPNANTILGILWSKKEAKKLTDADRAYAKALHDADPNSVDAPKLREIYENTKGGTIEDRAKAAARKKAAKAKIEELQKLPVKEQERLFQQLDEKLKADVLKYASWDTTGKRGLTWRNDK